MREILFQPREAHLEALQGQQFDLLVIGGGATGAGVAWDASLRGLKVALVEGGDFSSGTSSRSTKLIHGGVRYLEKALKGLDRQQYRLVRESLRERAIMLKMAPHLTNVISLLIPLYSWVEIPYYATGLKLYDWISTEATLEPSHLLSKQETVRNFPRVNQKDLRGSVVYQDGQFDDSRMNLSLILSASFHGASVANYLKVTSLNKVNGQCKGARVQDRWTGRSFDIRSKLVVNATGPYSDRIRRMDDPACGYRIKASSGTHILLPGDLTKEGKGILIPKTQDGRVLFVLPWMGSTLVGTTDSSCEVHDDPNPSEEDIQFLLRETSRYLDHEVSRDQVLSAWMGLRPLVQADEGTKSEAVVRDHHIESSASSLISITGGKWTTFRKMAEDVVDYAIEKGALEVTEPCQTEKAVLVGGENYGPRLPELLRDEYPIDQDVAEYLARSYGDRAFAVLEKGFHQRLLPELPYLEGEVIYAVQNEFACSPCDFLSRRIRLSFLNSELAKQALPRVVEIMAALRNWSPGRKQEIIAQTKNELSFYPN